MKKILSITLVFMVICSSLMAFSVSATNYTQTSKSNKFEILKTYIISHGIQKDKQWKISEEVSFTENNSNFTLSYDEINDEVIAESSMALENSFFRTEFRIKEMGRPFESTFENLLINEGLTLKVTEYTQPLFVDENYCPSAKSYDVIGNNISVLSNYSQAEKDKLKSIGEEGLSSGIVLTILSLGHHLANNDIDLSLPDFGFIHCDYYGSEPYVPDTLFELYIGQGAIYFSQGLYYETIDEIQTFCDACWYNMTAEQQQNALYYLNNAKSKLADYQFTTGKNYYNKGLYYEAKPYFESAVDYYEQLNYGTQWQSANDYLYNTNQRIKEWENRNTYTPSKSSSPSYYYNTFDNSSAPLYDSVTGKHRSGTSLMNGGGGWIYKYNYYSDQQKMIYDIGKYMDTLVDVGYVLVKEDSLSVLGWLNYDFRKGNERVYILIMANENKVHLQVYDR